MGRSARSPVLTIVLSRSDPTGASVLDTLTAWSAAGFVDNFVWLATNTLPTEPPPDAEDGDLTSFHGLMVQGGLRDHAELSKIVPAAEYRRVRLIALHLLPTAEGHDPALASWARALEGGLRSSQAAGPQQLVLINVAVAAAGVTGLPPEQAVLPGKWANVVVAPEDRASLVEAAERVQASIGFAGHAAFNVAVVGGLWSHLDEGPFDDPRHQVGGSEGLVVLARGFGRILDIRELPERAIEPLVGKSAFAIPYAMDPRVNRSIDPKGRIRAALDAFLAAEGEVLRGRPLEPDPDDQPPLPLPQRAPGALRRLLLGPAALDPSRNVALSPDQRRWARSFRFSLAPSGEVGPASANEEAGEDPPEELPPSANNVRYVAREVPADPRLGGMPAFAPPHPDLWRAVRQLCFGLVDGDRLPEGVADRLSGTRISVSPRWVAPKPNSAFPVPADLDQQELRAAGVPPGPLRACDARSADLLDRYLTRSMGAGKSEAERARVAVRARLRAWIAEEGRSDSLLWQLARHVSAELDGAAEEFNYARERADDDLEARRRELDARLRERQLQLRPVARWLAGGSVLLAGLVLAAVLSLAVLPAVITALAVPVLSLAVILSLAVLFVVGAVFSGAEVAAERQLRAAEQAKARAVAMLARWPWETDRLGALYQGLVDWSEIIGRLVHHPLGERTDAVVPVAPDVSAVGAPAALRVRVGAAPIEHIEALTRRVVREVFQPGWVLRLYGYVERCSMSRFGELTGRHDEPSPDDSPVRYHRPDRLPDDPLDGMEANPRLFLLSECTGTSRRYDADARRHKAKEIRKVCRNVPFDDLVVQLRDPDESGSGRGASVPAPEGASDAGAALRFLQPILPTVDGSAQVIPFAPWGWSPAGRIRRQARVEQVQVWCPAALAGPERSQVGQTTVTQAADETSGDTYLFQVTRLDLSPECETGEVALFGTPGQPPPPGSVDTPEAPPTRHPEGRVSRT